MNKEHWLLRRHLGKIIVAILLISVYINLGFLCSYNLSLQGEQFNAGDLIEAKIEIHNPLPFPVYYNGHYSIDRIHRYISGGIIPRVVHGDLSSRAGEIAAEAAGEIGGRLWGSTWLPPLGSNEIGETQFVPTIDGEVEIEVMVRSRFRTVELSSSVTVREWMSKLSSVEEPGVILFADIDETDPDKSIHIFIKNNNSFAVKIPCFDRIEKYTESKSSSVIMHIDFLKKYFEIPAASCISIWDTDRTSSEPIYYEVYGQTVTYPSNHSINCMNRIGN